MLENDEVLPTHTVLASRGNNTVVGKPASILAYQDEWDMLGTYCINMAGLIYDHVKKVSA